jgi:Zn-dependent M28 family amino/carboxypeptidase
LAPRTADRGLLDDTLERGLRAENSNASPNSDHWPFLRRGVPAIFLIPGEDWEGVTREEKEELHRRWDHYHLPSDQWHPDFPYAGLKRYAELALAIGRQAADEAERPRTY